jgi:hypothetical protein
MVEEMKRVGETATAMEVDEEETQQTNVRQRSGFHSTLIIN